MPIVSVPVLSKTTVSTSASRSSAVPSLISSPRRNSRPEAAVTTAGTASPSAQGQVMISTAAATFSATRASRVIQSQPRKLDSAMRCTTGA